MKKLMILFLSVALMPSMMKADDDRPITFEQLPQQSQQFIKKYFADNSIALVKMEDEFFNKSYDVIFTNGTKIEFDKDGVWKEVDCKYAQLPVDIIPLQIRDYVSKNYPDAKIIKIEKKKRGRYEVDLTNGFELEFDAQFNLIDIDR